jgi:hypothetical protein
MLPLGMVALSNEYFLVTAELEVIMSGVTFTAVPVAEMFVPKKILGVTELVPSPPVMI